METLKKTPLNEIHRKLGAKMVPFGGWDMPVQYTSIIQEHTATRTQAGLFDVSHMGEIFLEGKSSGLLSFLEKITCNLVSSMTDGQVQYNALLNNMGGLVDDITLYKFNEEKYMICCNASNVDNVFDHLKKFLQNFPIEISIKNDSANWHQIAIQGPVADEILTGYLNRKLDDIGYYKFKVITFNNEEMIVSRTGYTGEDGFEIYSTIPTGVKIWNELLEKGKSKGLVPVGLGARDTLRLEAKYPLYGHELNSNRTPVESGIGWIVKEKSIPFLAYEKIIPQKQNGSKEKVTGVKLLESGVLREHYNVLNMNGQIIGETTSGTFSPTLKEGIGMAMIKSEYIKDGLEVKVEIRGIPKKAIIFTKNFIQGSVKKK